MTALIWALVGYGDRGQRALGGLRASLLRCRGFSCILPAALEAVAVAVHLQDVDVVGEAVKQSAGEPLGAEDVGPFVEGQVGGDQDGAPLVALAEDLEEEFRAGGGQGDEAQFVDDQQPEARQVAWEFLAAPADHRVLLIMGPADTGKTHLALGVARECGDAPAYCIAGDIIRSLRATYERADLSYSDTSQSLRSAPCLVLDYVHAPELTNDYAEDEIFQLLASRYDNLLPTIVTTVLRYSELARCSQRVTRRLHRGLVLDLWDLTTA